MRFHSPDLRPACLCLLAVASAAVFAEDAVYRKGAQEFWGRNKSTPDERIRLIDPVPAGGLRCRPTFTSCGIVWGAPQEILGLVLEYFPKGDEGRSLSAEIPYFPEVKNYRGSLMDLSEDTEYVVRFAADGKTLATGPFRTWKSDVPVARTVVIDPDRFTAPYVISARGRPDGWIRYVAKDGRPIVNTTDDVPLFVKGAAYVILEGIDLKGGPAQHCVVIEDSTGVRIRNCEFSEWGRDALMHFFPCRGRWSHILPNGEYETLNYDGAIRIGRRSRETVVERCYVHDARYPSSSWIHSHPAGPEAVFMAKPDHSTVLRWNDFVGSDKNRWNDAVESAGNFDEDGGFNRDADIDGNFMIFANDDCIELDGGNQNVRCRYNRFEGALCPVSVQGTMVSPTYVTDNLILATVEEHGLESIALKTCGSDMLGKGTVIHFDRNTCLGCPRAFDVSDGSPTCRYRASGNRFGYEPFFKDAEKAVNGRFSDNACDRTLDPALPYSDLPRRPVPYRLSVGRIAGVKLANGRLNRETVSVRLVCKGTGYRQRFAIRRNKDVDWFEVEPSAGVVESGRTIDFTVRFLPEKMAGRHCRRGAFLVRTADGFSRPVSVDAETDFVPPIRPAGAGASAYAHEDAARPIKPVLGKWMEFAVEIAEAGTYALLVHGGGDYAVRAWPKLEVAVDDDKPQPTWQHTCTRDHFSWTMLTPGHKPFRFVDITRYQLKRGRHRIRLRVLEGEFSFDALVFTQTPKVFEEL